MQRKREVPAVLTLILTCSLCRAGELRAQMAPLGILPPPLAQPAASPAPTPPLAIAKPAQTAVAPEAARADTPAPAPAPTLRATAPPAPAPTASVDSLERLRKAADLLIEVNRESGVPRSPYGELIYDIAIRHAVNPHLVAAMIHVESAFNPRAVSRKGAYGLMQLLPATARRFGLTRKKDLFDPRKNLDAGVRYLKWLTQRFGGDAQKILAAYNAGEGAVERYGGIPPYRETEQYVRKIFSLLGFGSVDPVPPSPVQAAAPPAPSEQGSEPAGP